MKYLLKKRDFLLFVLFLFSFSVSCTQKSFVCWNKEETEAMAFTFDDLLGKVIVRDIQDYYVLNSKKGPLNSEMPGGAYTLQMGEDMITLEVIQDTVLTKTRLPSGRIYQRSF